MSEGWYDPAVFQVRMPDYEKTVAKLWAPEYDEGRDLMLRTLLKRLWVEADSISDEVKLIIRDNIAAAHFAADPVTQQRRAEALASSGKCVERSNE